MLSQPKIDLAKLRSQISRRVDNSFPVFARLVWHTGHADDADREASWVCHARHAMHEIGMPSVTDLESHNRQIYLGELEVTVSCLAINADYNKKSYICHNVCHGIDWQN